MSTEAAPPASANAPSAERPVRLAVSVATRVVLVIIVAAISLAVLWLLKKPIGWLVIAGFIAIAVSGPIRLLEKRLKRRGAAIGIVYLGVILMPVLVVAVLVPPLVEQGNNLATNAPEYARDVTEAVQKNETLRDLDEKYDLTGKLQEQAGQLPAKVGDVAGALANIGAGIVSSIFAGVTILILAIFMSGAAPRWRRALVSTQPQARGEAMNRLFDRVGDAVGGYVRGALLQALIAGVLSYIVLAILGVPYPVALALIIFLLDLVPLVGATIGAILVGIVTLFSDFPTDTIIWVIWSIIYQQLENTVIQPRIQSKAVSVEPFVVLVAVLFGSTLFGVFGALLAIPAAAAIQIGITEYARYRRSGRIAGISAAAVTGGGGTVVIPAGTGPPPPAGKTPPADKPPGKKPASDLEIAERPREDEPG